MSFTNLFRMDYWFGQPFSAHGVSFWIFAIFFLVLILGGIISRIICQYKKEKIDKVILKRFSTFGMTLGLFGIIWLFLRQEKVPFLAWRFWLMLWVIIAVWWLSKILEYIVRRVPQINQEKEERKKRDKYLIK